jgi:hypothetical protein
MLQRMLSWLHHAFCPELRLGCTAGDQAQAHSHKADGPKHDTTLHGSCSLHGHVGQAVRIRINRRVRHASGAQATTNGIQAPTA